jgi:hypothetical protein
MHFNKIKITKDDEVDLFHLDPHKHSKNEITTTGVNPLPSFIDAVTAFLPVFLRVVPELESVKERLRVTTISLGEKDGDRSLQVSASFAVEACGGAVISMTTPRLTEPPEGAKEGHVYLTKTDLRLIDHVEGEAERYYKGETAQAEMFAGRSENAARVDERMAGAEVASTRRPRAPRASKPTGGQAPGELQNPDQTIPPTDETLRELLLRVGKDIAVDQIARWSSSERDGAQRYAERVLAGHRDTSMPLCIQRSANAPLVDSRTSPVIQ